MNESDIDPVVDPAVDGSEQPPVERSRQQSAVTQLRKGALSLVILSVCGRREMYAKTLSDELGRNGLKVTTSTLYPALSRLEDAGMLSSRLVEVTTGPARRYFRTTRLGRRELRQLTRAWNELAEVVDSLTADDVEPGTE